VPQVSNMTSLGHQISPFSGLFVSSPLRWHVYDRTTTDQTFGPSNRLAIDSTAKGSTFNTPRGACRHTAKVRARKICFALHVKRGQARLYSSCASLCIFTRNELAASLSESPESPIEAAQSVETKKGSLAGRSLEIDASQSKSLACLPTHH
jgi:hypothetical protein